MRTVLTLAIALLLAAPAAGQTVTKRFTLYGCSDWACHTFRFTLEGIGEGFGGVLESYRYSFTSRYHRSAGYPRQFSFQDPSGLGPMLNDIQSPYNAQDFDHIISEDYHYYTTLGPWRPKWGFVDDVLGPKGTFFGGTNGDFIGFTKLYVTPEPASLLLLGTGLAGIAGAAARRRRR